MRLNGDCVLHCEYREKYNPHQLETAALDSCPLFRVLRHRTPSSPIGLSEVTEQALRLIARILLIQRKKKYPSRKEKSAFT